MVLSWWGNRALHPSVCFLTQQWLSAGKSNMTLQVPDQIHILDLTYTDASILPNQVRFYTQDLQPICVGLPKDTNPHTLHTPDAIHIHSSPFCSTPHQGLWRSFSPTPSTSRDSYRRWPRTMASQVQVTPQMEAPQPFWVSCSWMTITTVKLFSGVWRNLYIELTRSDTSENTWTLKLWLKRDRDIQNFIRDSVPNTLLTHINFFTLFGSNF